MQALANKKWTPEGQIETRYRKARKEWDDRMGGAVIQARNWRLATLLSLGLVLVSLAGTIYFGAQPKAVPHIVQVDRIGAPTYVGPIGQSAREYRSGDVTINYHRRRLIEQTRSVSSDPAIVRKNWTDADTVITANAASQLSAYAERSDPVKRAQDARVTVDLSAIVQVSKETWQADWEEKTWARGSSLFAPMDDSPVAANVGPTALAAATAGAASPAAAVPWPQAADGNRLPDPNMQERKNDFLGKTGSSSAEYLEKTLSEPLSPYELKAGTVIPTVLITGINSDLPGKVVGQVRENVYDSVTGNHLLIPQGSRLIASYDSMVAWGQERVLVCWQHLIRPDGSSISLECMPGVDLAGYAGFADDVDNHWWKIISGASFSSLLAATAQRSQGDVTGFQPTFPQVWASNAAGQINQAGQQLTQKNLPRSNPPSPSARDSA